MFAAAATQLAFLQYERAVTRTPVTLAGFFAGISYIRQQPHPARHHHARPVRGAARRRRRRCCRSSPRTCSTPARPASASCAPRPRSARLLITVVADALVVHARRRPHRVHRGRGVRRRDHRVRVDRLVLAGLVCARRHGRRRCDQRRHPHDAAAARDARTTCAAGSAPSIRCSSACRTRSAISAPALVANFIGAVPAVLVGGIGTLMVVLLCMRLFPELYRVEGFHNKREPSDARLLQFRLRLPPHSALVPVSLATWIQRATSAAT